MSHVVRMSSREFIGNWLAFIEETLKELETNNFIEIIVTPDCSTESIASAKIVQYHLRVLETTARMHHMQWLQYYALESLGDLTSEEIPKIKEFVDSLRSKK